MPEGIGGAGSAFWWGLAAASGALVGQYVILIEIEAAETNSEAPPPRHCPSRRLGLRSPHPAQRSR